MKKVVVTLLLIIIFPLNTLAYSEYIIPGGENVGINIKSKGLMVVGFYKVDGKYIGEDSVKVGDKIISIEGSEISSIDEMTNIINNSKKEDNINITVLRNNKYINSKMHLIKLDGVLKTGLYVKDEINGIGTISYIDPNTKIYGALGHEVIESNTNMLVEVKNGSIFESNVKSIDRSTNGNPGSKNAEIEKNKLLGNINKNTIKGIYGKYNKIPNKKILNVASFDEIEKGKATVYTTLKNKEIISFDINIINIDKDNKNTSKAFSFVINDKTILDKTGGVVQGMSGSPIVQNKKIIGAVTHVVVDNVTKGYAIFIRTMLSEGDKNN